MSALRFDPETCLACETVDCVMKCQYIDLDLARAKWEHDRVARGEMSSILTDCITCYACEEYCPNGNHPFYRLVEVQERLGIHPVPIPIEKSQVVMMGPRGKIQEMDLKSPLINMCFFEVMRAVSAGPSSRGPPPSGEATCSATSCSSTSRGVPPSRSGSRS